MDENNNQVEPNLATAGGEIPNNQEIVDEPVETMPQDKKKNKMVTIIVVAGLLLLVICSLVAMILLASNA